MDEVARTQELLELAKRFHLSELEWVEQGLRVVIRRETSAPVLPLPAAEATEPAEKQSRLVELYAPMTGVFYRAPSPDAPPYVEVGDFVEEGQIVCLIEAMKVFNEVPAERSGRVKEICASSGQLVEQGTVLFRLEPGEVEE